MNAIDHRCGPSADEELVYQFRNRIAFFVRTRMHDPSAVQDLTQDILLAVVVAVRRGQLRNPDRLAAFIYGTARNIVKSHLRARSRHPRLVPIDSDDWSITGDDPADDRERRALVRRALSTLDSRDRQILLLTLVTGLKSGEIATHLGLTSEVVRARKSRALKKVIAQVRAWSRRSPGITAATSSLAVRSSRSRH